MKIITCEGLVINRSNFGEADVYITVWSDILGKITFPVLGIRKTKKREASALDFLVCSKLTILKKKDKYSISNFETIYSFEDIKKNIDKISISLYILSILNSLIGEKDEKKEIYKLTIKTLKYIEKEISYSKMLFCLSFYMFKIIKNEGILERDLKQWNFNSDEIEEQNIINKIINGKIKEIIEINYENKLLEKVVLKLEKYLNFHEDLSLDLKKYLLG
ncbi:MAG: DNA repair protein RecO [Fusobacteriaceae bacterium]